MDELIKCDAYDIEPIRFVKSTQPSQCARCGRKIYSKITKLQRGGITHFHRTWTSYCVNCMPEYLTVMESTLNRRKKAIRKIRAYINKNKEQIVYDMKTKDMVMQI